MIRTKPNKQKQRSRQKNKHRENKKVSEQRKELKDESNPLGLN